MASNRETITRDIILNVKTRITEAEKSAEKIKRTLADINVSDSFKKSMTGSLADVLKDMDKLKEKLNTAMTPAQMNKWNQQWGNISDKLNDIVQTVSSKKLTPKDLIFDENTQKRIAAIDASLKKIEATKARLTKQSAKAEAIVSSMSQDNQLKQAKDLGLSAKAQQDIVNLVSKNLNNEQYINRIISERAPKYQEILTAQSKITQLAKEQSDYEAMRAALNKPGKMTNAMKSQMLASEMVDTTGLNSSSTKDQFRQAFDNAPVRDFASEIDGANAALTRLQNSVSSTQRQAYETWSQDLIRSAREVSANLDEDGRHAEALNQELNQLNSQGMQQAERGLSELEQNARAAVPALDAVGEEAQQSARQLEELNAQERFFRDMQFKIAQIFGLANAFVMLRQFMRASAETIRELDAAFTEIAVVTEKTTTQLWESFDEYNQMAKELGSTTKDAVTTSALYYQQGLNTADVMDLTTQTIKMARIANMDYASATEAMTSAIRGFKMEMSDSQRVVDVYSALAAKSAVDTQQLAVAISKVASIAQSAGMELETTSAFLSQIIETTQEAPETAGTALKTIIARFTEMNKNISSFKDENGEIVDVNKTEEALKTVGIMLRDEVTGQIRDVGSVFIELAAKWDSLDRNAQRYVATVASGARQQSRFIAMMDNYKRTQELIGIATNANGAATTQFNKTLDSMQSKLNQLKANFETIINNLISNNIARGFLDILNNIMSVLGNIASMGPGVFIPTVIGLFSTIKNLTVSAAKLVESVFSAVPNNVNNVVAEATTNSESRVRTWIERIRTMLRTAGWRAVIQVDTEQDGTTTDIDGNVVTPETAQRGINASGNRFLQAVNKYSSAIILGTTAITTALTMSGQEVIATGASVGQGLGSLVGSIWGPIGTAIGTAGGALIGGALAQIDEWFKYGFENTKANIKAAKRVAEDLAQTQSEYDAANSTLVDSGNTFKTLSEKVSDGLSLTAEEAEDFARIQDELGRTYPELITGRNAETGLLTVSTDKLNELIKARQAEAEIIAAEAAAAQYSVDQKERGRKNSDVARKVANETKTGRSRSALETGDMGGIDLTNAPAEIKEINKAILASLKRSDENTAKEVDEQLDKLKSAMKDNDKAWAGYSDQVDAYINSVYNAVGEIQTNVTAEQQQLQNLANFDANLLKYYGTIKIDGQDVSRLTKAMTGDFSTYLAKELGAAVESGEVDPEADDKASNSIASWLQRQLSGNLGQAYKELSLLSDDKKAEYDSYSALIPYFKGVKGGMTKAFEDLGLDASNEAQRALVQTLRAASDSIPISQLAEDAQSAIRAVATSGNLEDAVKLAKSLSDFNINSSSLTSLKAIRESLDGFKDNADVSTFINNLSEKIKTLGYTSEEAAARMQSLTSKLAQITKTETASSEGKLSAEDVANVVAEHGSKYGFTIDNFNYDTSTGGYSAVGIDWDTIRKNISEDALKEATQAVVDTNQGIIHEMSAVIGKDFTGDITGAMKALQETIAKEKETNLREGDFNKEQGFTRAQQEAYGKAKDYATHNTMAVKEQMVAQQVLDLDGVENYDSAMQAAVATSRKFAKAIEEQRASASDLTNEYKITEAQIAAIEKEYPQLKGRMDDVNKSAEDYFSIMNEVAELETVKQLEETGKNIGSYLASMEGMKTTSSEFQTGVQAINDLLGDGMVNAQFAANNLDLIRKACEGDYKAFTTLQQKLAQEILIKAGSSVDFSALMKGLVSVSSLSKEAVAALTAAGMFEIETTFMEIPNPAALMPGMAGLGKSLPTVKMPIQMIKPSNKPMYTKSNFGSNYSTPKGKKGGGGSKDKYEVKAEDYYNEIKAIERLVDKLEDLKEAREKSQLSPDAYKKNVEASLKTSRQLQDSLHQYNNKLRNDRAYLAKQINGLGAPGAAVVHNGNLMVNKKGIQSLDQKTQEALDKWIDQWDELTKSIEANSDQYMEIEDNLKELAKTYQEAYTTMEQKILDILIEQDQKEIELTQKKYDKIKEADSDYLDALKKNIDARRRERDKENNYKELAKKEKRLALLKRDTSGIYAAEILALEEELAKTRQDMGDQETDDMVTKLEDEAETRAKDYDKQMKELEEFQKDKEETMTAYNAKVNEIMQMGADDQLKWLQTYDKEFLTATETARQQYLDGWQKTMNEVESFKSNVSGGTIVDSKTKAEQMASEARKYLTSKSYGTGAQDISSYNAEGALGWYKQYIANGRTDLPPDVVEAFKKIILAKYMWEGKGTPKFAKGGMVDFTGPAWVDGTKSSPEAFLSAEETKSFKMLAQLLQRSLTYSGTAAQVDGAGGVQVEQLTIEVQSIGSDYDVDRMIDRIKQDIVGASGDRNINILNRRR